MALPEIFTYYPNLLILQYIGKLKAYAQVQATVAPVLEGDSNTQFLLFAGTPASGSFTLLYNGIATSSIAWNASTSTIQSDLNAILTAPLTVTVTGSIALGLTFTFTGYTSSVLNLSANTTLLLDVHSNAVLSAVSWIGDQLPLEIQNAFNLIGDDIAVGAQLDTLGKYVGVTRNGFGLFGPVTLDDTDFLKLIQMAIIKNNAGSSLASIESFLNQFFPDQIFVFDYQNMQIGYLIDTSVGSIGLIELFATEGLLPRPMGVAMSIIAAPIIDEFFAFRTYQGPAWVNTTPFNSYTSYNTSWLWLTYQDALIVP